MSSEVLARKYRPQIFSNVVGQEHIVTVLQNSISLGKLHHGYIFSGTRGIGKTTIARIFAKALNCHALTKAFEPCNECVSCKEITVGRNLEFIEIDAASRTGVDDMRELLESSIYKPSSSKYRIYLIDEVHMLSKSSFNALLKTLEEPPEHLIFLMATTEIEKVPSTVLSRCLQLSLKVVPPLVIANHLSKLLASESLNADQVSIELIAKAAQGSIRDALTLTDQAIAHGNGVLENSEVANFLGSIDDSYLLAVIQNIIKGDGDAAYISLQALHEFNVEYSLVIESFIEHFHAINMAKASFGSSTEIHKELASMADAEFLVLMQEIFLQSLEKYSIYPDPKMALETAVIRSLAFHPLKQDTSLEEKKNSIKADARSSDSFSDEESKLTSQPPGTSSPDKPTNSSFTQEDWHELFQSNLVSGFTREVFLDFGFKAYLNNVLTLLQPAKSVEPTKAMIDELKQLILAINNVSLSIHFELSDPEICPRDLLESMAESKASNFEEALTENSSVQYLIENFDAKISIKSD